VRELTEPWGPWRGLMAYYALIAHERGLLRRR
jgi:3-methyladenine DNA glycosylase/8-oxoguanine DNA glycosylase